MASEESESFRWIPLSSTTIVVLGLAVLWPISVALKKWFRMWWYTMKIGGPYGPYPLLFNVVTHRNFMKCTPVVDYTVSLFSMFVGYATVFKNHYAYYLGFKPFVMIYSPKGMEAILSDQENLDKSEMYDLLLYWLGTGLLISKKDKWKVRRKMLTPAFHFRILEDILPVMNKEAKILSDKLGKMSKDGPVNVVPLVHSCTLSIICETAMGVEIKAQENKDSPYVKAVAESSEAFMYRLMNPYLWSNFFFYYCTPYGWKMKKSVDLMRNFSLKVIEKRKKSLLLEKSKGKENVKDDGNANEYFITRQRKSFIDILLEVHLDNSEFTLDDIREEVDTFMFEGHDTTAVGVCFALYLIGLYNDVQEKLYEELQSVFGTDVSRSVTKEDLKELKYMECVIKESQRLYPSVPIVARKIQQDFYIDGHLIPKGCNVNVFIYALHHDPEVFPDPEKFDPDRFLPENSRGRNPYSFVPFSAGSRNCIGQKFAVMEEKVVLATILRKYKVRSLDPRDKINLVAELVLRAKTDLNLQFIPRK